MIPVRITLRQILLLVVALAVLFACFRPTVNAKAEERNDFLQVDLLLLPWIAAVLVLALAKPGPAKGWSIAVLLAIPFASFIIMITLRAVALYELGYMGFSMIVVVLIADSFISLCLVPIAKRIIPKRCPNCGRRTMLRDASGDDPRPAEPATTHRCLSCKSLFRAWHRGPWFPVPEAHP